MSRVAGNNPDPVWRGRPGPREIPHQTPSLFQGASDIERAAHVEPFAAPIRNCSSNLTFPAINANLDTRDV